MQFFKKKSDDQPRRSVSQNSLRHDAQRSQVNGAALSGGDKAYHLKNASLDNPGSMPMSYICIKSSDAELEVLSQGFCQTKPPQRSSQLSKSLEKVLRDKEALPYFIQYMDSVGSGNLVKFWLDADTFRLTSLSRMNFESSLRPDDVAQPKQNYFPPDSANFLAAVKNFSPSEKFENATLGHSHSSSFAAQLGRKSHHLGSVTAHGHEQFPQSLSPSPPARAPKIACESASLASNKEPGASDCHVNPQPDAPRSFIDVRPSGQDADGKVFDPPEISSAHSSQNSTDGIVLPVSDCVAPNLQPPLSCRVSVVPTTSESLEDDTVENVLDSLQTLNKSIENDAIVIFSKYLSPDCLTPISISDHLRSLTMSRVSHRDGTVDPQCFDHCQQYVFDLMDTRHYSQFLQSVFYIRHQIDILSQLLLVDILYNDTALSYFTEFMEERKAMLLLQCFLDLDNFQRHLLSQGIDYDANEAQNDAMIIYDKYISMQATQPVRFDDNVRLKVESNICRESGLLPDCFHLPCQLTLQHMEKDAVVYRRKRIGSDASSEKSAGSQSTGNESLSSKNTYLARDTSGQHFAKALNRFSDNMRIDSSLFNPDSLWHRPNAGRMKFGKVTELGQFVSDFDPDPDHDKKKLAPFFTLTKKREREKSEEDMAWQVAQQIISAVMTETGSDCLPLDV